MAATAGTLMKRMSIGHGQLSRDHSPPDPETGECDHFCTLAWGSTLAEVEVETETGEVGVWIDEIPVTPERRLRALEEQG